MRTLVTGATGFVGRELVARLDDVVVLGRSASRAATLPGQPRFHLWSDPCRELPPAEAFEGVEAVIHLAGEPVAEGRWTAAKKARIRDSRVEATRNLVRAMSELERPPSVLVSASAIGVYGSRGDQSLSEDAAAGEGFLAEVCRDWESAAGEARAVGIRVVNARVGIVLGAGGGALQKMLLPFKMGVGGRVGSGKQWMSWIHRTDLVELLRFVAATPQVDGPVNAVSPNPVTNAEFTRTLARVLRRPALFPVPGLALRLGLGEFATVLLESQRVEAGRVVAHGFDFRYPTLEGCLREVLGKEVDHAAA